MIHKSGKIQQLRRVMIKENNLNPGSLLNSGVQILSYIKTLTPPQGYVHILRILFSVLLHSISFSISLRARDVDYILTYHNDLRRDIASGRYGVPVSNMNQLVSLI